MLQAYPHLHGLEEVNALPLPEFHLQLLCMYNFVALQNGVDPENPPDSSKGSNPTAERKVSGIEAARVIQELAELKKKGGGTE